jgi:hypothetical protein
MNYSKLTDKELIAECKRQRKLLDKYAKRDRQNVEIELRLKEIYLLFKNIKIYESSNNRRKVD